MQSRYMYVGRRTLVDLGPGSNRTDRIFVNTVTVTNNGNQL
jgi:hypothetical protein